MAPSPSRLSPHPAPLTGSSSTQPATISSLPRPNPPLNPDAALFSPSSITSDEDLLEWLVFSPSSSEEGLQPLVHIYVSYAMLNNILYILIEYPASPCGVTN
jgi:hypothetical protein